MPEKERSPFGELWATFFGKSWPMWVGGIVLAILNICLFLVKSPWGGSGSYVNWGQNLYSSLGILSIPGLHAVTAHHYGLLGLMTVLGAFAGALLSREFAIRIPPAGEMLKGFVGGSLMALGSTMGIGCTVGGFLSGWPSLSGGAIFLALGFGIGCFLALRYLLWEMEALPSMSMGKSYTLLAAKGTSGVWQPILGFVFLLGLFIWGTRYYRTDAVFTWFAVIGILLGLINQRSRFCVTRAFREPFMTGESEAPIAIFAALLVGLFGFTVIKYMGVGTATAGEARILAMTWVYPHFWLRALIGGIIFGLGMTVAGGCAVGTLWRTGEGQVKLWFSALGFLLVAPLSKKFIVPGFSSALPEWAQRKVFLPDTLGYWGAVLLFLVIILLWYLFVKWNERTGKFSAV
jgi:uncharacterized membrane protein YedE/YeeE